MIVAILLVFTYYSELYPHDHSENVRRVSILPILDFAVLEAMPHLPHTTKRSYTGQLSPGSYPEIILQMGYIFEHYPFKIMFYAI